MWERLLKALRPWFLRLLLTQRPSQPHSLLLPIDFLVFTAILSLFFKNFYWRVVILKYCVRFCYRQTIHPLFFGFLPHLGQHKALGRVPCAV